MGGRADNRDDELVGTALASRTRNRCLPRQGSTKYCFNNSRDKQARACRQHETCPRIFTHGMSPFFFCNFVDGVAIFQWEEPFSSCQRLQHGSIICICPCQSSLCFANKIIVDSRSIQAIEEKENREKNDNNFSGSQLVA